MPFAALAQERAAGLTDNADHPAAATYAPAPAGAEAQVEPATPAPRIRVGFDTIAGAPRYAQRTSTTGTATTVRFVSSRPRAGGAVVGGGGLPSGLPVSGARLSSDYGYRVHPVSGRGASHHGVDLAVASGTPVVATSDGVVEMASWWGGYGLMVALDHGGGMETRYAHLSSIAVRPGDRVMQGQVIGRSGSTGNSTGPHVHYEVRMGGQSVDPLR
ncbi:M23 family metallopeptidase [Aurantiacibacter luteus]|nr:M23 family metallopeptidase [Aurantiacibacter luteus]